MTIRVPRDGRGRLKQPYSGSRVPVDRSKAQITELLRAYGAEGVAWTDNFATGAVELRFVVKDELGRGAAYKIVPAAFKAKHSTWDPLKGRNVSQELPDWARALRLLHAWLKTKLESIAYGLTVVEQEFLAQQIVRDAQGRETTVGELVVPAIAAGGGQLSLPGPAEAEVVR